jgi:small ligand-binding sensory domain FIST
MDLPVFAGALSTDGSSARAESEVVDALRAGLGGRAPDLVLAFATHHHGSALEELGPRIARATGARALAGCTGESVVGAGREIEQQPALSLFGAILPETRVEVFQVRATQRGDAAFEFSAFPRLVDRARASMLVFGEPYSFPMDAWLTYLDATLPGVRAIGGMASGGSGPGQNLLISHDGLHEQGLLGVLIEGATEVCTVVSQGCRPVGKPWVITACEQNVVQKLGGRPALDVLMSTLGELGPVDQRAFRRGPFVGLAIDAAKSVFERGDFLVRGILGLSEGEKVFAVGEHVRRGQTLQFLVRDAASAGEDLRHSMRAQGVGDAAIGALLFSCNGRGSRLFKQPDHDATCVLAGLERQVPLAGFFAAGEVGPVGGRNFLHGFTAAVAILRRRTLEPH